MLAPTSATDAGKRLRAARKRLRLSTREVADLSREIALKRNAPDFFISRTWLCRLEAGKLKLNIYRLQSLSLIYRLGLDEILSYFGVDMRDAGTEQKLVGLPHTYLVTPTLGGAQSTLVAPLELREKVDFASTNLVSRMFERWGEIPVTLLQHMDWRDSLYGYIGIEDRTLYPMLRPGSFVKIDSQQTNVLPGGWHDEFERPIYFVELRDNLYVCCWCDVNGSQLVLLANAAGESLHLAEAFVHLFESVTYLLEGLAYGRVDWGAVHAVVPTAAKPGFTGQDVGRFPRLLALAFLPQIKFVPYLTA